MANIRVGLCQMSVAEEKSLNITNAVKHLSYCHSKGADIAVLPEMFNCPYDISKFSIYAESIENGETVKAISDAAKRLSMFIVAGSIPEASNGKLYNTSLVFDKQGRIIAKHRKVHLFDINIPGSIVFRESEVLSAGKEVTVVDTEFGKIGVAICFDMRFPELYMQMCQLGAVCIITPGAFNMVTGPAHWELLVRARALDNMLFHAAVSPARNENSNYIAYGYSMVCNPWGQVLAQCSDKEDNIVVDINTDEITSSRRRLPVISETQD